MTDVAGADSWSGLSWQAADICDKIWILILNGSPFIFFAAKQKNCMEARLFL